MPTPAGTAPRSRLSWKTDTGLTTVIELDAVRDINDDRTSTLTKHPIESGAVINDHVIQNPNNLSLTILCTNHPISNANQNLTQSTLPVRKSLFVPRGLFAITQAAGAAVGAVVDLLSGNAPGEGSSIQVTVLEAPSSVQRVQELHAQLIDLKNQATLIEVTTDGVVYENQILTSVKKTKGPGQYGLGVFNCTFETLTTVEATLVPPKDAADLIARVKALKAAKAAKELADKQKAEADAAMRKGKTVGAKILDLKN